METVRDMWNEAIAEDHKGLDLLIDFLLNEKKVLELDDDKENLNHYLQPRFRRKMNEYLVDYEKRR